MHYKRFFDVLGHALHEKSRKFLLTVLCRCVNDDGLTWESHTTLAKHLGINIRTVTRGIEQLESSGDLVTIIAGVSENKPSIYLITTGLYPAQIYYTLQSYFALSPLEAASKTAQIFELKKKHWQTTQARQLAARLGISYPQKKQDTDEENFDEDERFNCSTTSLHSLTGKQKEDIDEHKADLYKSSHSFHQIDPSRAKYKVSIKIKGGGSQNGNSTVPTPPSSKPVSATKAAKACQTEPVLVAPPISEPDLDLPVDLTQIKDQAVDLSQIGDEIKDQPATMDIFDKIPPPPTMDILAADKRSIDYGHFCNQLWTFCTATMDILAKILPSLPPASTAKSSTYEASPTSPLNSFKHDHVSNIKHTHEQQPEISLSEQPCVNVCDINNQSFKAEEKTSSTNLVSFTRQLFTYAVNQTGPIRDTKREKQAIAWLREQGYLLEECKACFDLVMRQTKDPLHWRKGSASWYAVVEEIINPKNQEIITAIVAKSLQSQVVEVKPQLTPEQERFEQIASQEIGKLQANGGAWQLLFIRTIEELMIAEGKDPKEQPEAKLMERANKQIKKKLVDAALARMEQEKNNAGAITMQQSAKYTAIGLIGSEKVKALEAMGLTIVSKTEAKQLELLKLEQSRNAELRAMLAKALADKSTLIYRVKQLVREQVLMEKGALTNKPMHTT